MVNQWTHGRMMSLVVLQFHYSNKTMVFPFDHQLSSYGYFSLVSKILSRTLGEFQPWEYKTKKRINMLKRKVTEKPVLKLSYCC